jgi:RHS repeat-associated protein
LRVKIGLFEEPYLWEAGNCCYTTTIAYDDLDRPVSKVIGKRNLSPADLALFGSGTEKFTWDSGPNHKGYLRYWQAFAPGSSTAAITLDLGNNNQGQRTVTTHTLNIAGYPSLLRQVRQNFFLFGGVRNTVYGDTFGGSSRTVSEMTYDARGLPAQMRLFRTGEPHQTLAVQTRNVAGLVTKRRTNTTGAMPFVESNWTYDKLGRVASQVVQKGPGPTQVVRQDLTYFGNDNPKTLTHYLGTTPKQFQYGYDLRHQLTSVASTTAGYFTANYSYGVDGRFTRATEAQTIAPLPAGTEVKPRDVHYVYGGTDPEQATALTNVSNGQTYASYTYDAAGNQITRTYPATNESWDYVYDGQDQLRRATRKRNGVVQGSEEYWYDNDGQRIAVVKRNAAGTKTELIWFIGDTQAHYNGAGAVTHVYSHLSMGTPVARVDRTGNATTAVEYQFHGLASNTIAAVDQNGTINASFSYAPFGEVIEATNAGGAQSGTALHRRRLNDKYEDDLTALAYYGARFYDKRLIGWTQPDPLYIRLPDAAQLGSPRRASIYKFSLNNPLLYMDPDGLNSVLLGEQYIRGPGPSLSEYKSEAEIRDYWRRIYESESDWEVSTDTCAYNTNRCSFILNQNALARLTVVPVMQVAGEREEEELAKKILREWLVDEPWYETLGKAAAFGLLAGVSPTVALAAGLSQASNDNEIVLPIVLGGVTGNLAKGTVSTADKLLQAANSMERGGLTAAGRALQKHGGRAGSAFPAATGNAASINQQGLNTVREVLTNPNRIVTRHHARFGNVTEIRAPDGRGLRFSSDGKFIGFLEP